MKRSVLVDVAVKGLVILAFMTPCIAILLVNLLTPGCSEQSRARNWDGSGSVRIAAGRKLVNVTWKGDSPWFLTRPMHEDETPESYEFGESSAFGAAERRVVIHEAARPALHAPATMPTASDPVRFKRMRWCQEAAWKAGEEAKALCREQGLLD